MCGFAGIYRRRGSDREFACELTAMARALAHRGPDSEGIWHDSQFSIGLAHRRLAIQDLSPLGHQPMHSRSGRYVIAYNGEVYNFVELRAELTDRGAQIHGESDTEVMLAAFEAWGIEQSLKRFVGMFAFALWDQRDRLLYLARDRMGEKPLYYGWQGDSFVFGSELKALRRCREWNGQVSREALSLLLRFNYIPAPYSIYQNIFKLQPGTFLTLSAEHDSAVPRPQVYWSATEVFEQGARNPHCLDPEETVEELELLLRHSVRQQMISDVPLGAFLSGGVDSSTVVALMQSVGNTPVKTFSIGFDVPGFDEAQHAKRVSQHLETDHTELYLSSQQAMDVIPLLGEMYDEPFADSSQIPTHLVAKLARSQVTVALSGDGGDELFCGYDRYFDIHDQWRRRPAPGLVRHAAARLGLTFPERLAGLALYPWFKLFSATSSVNLGNRFHRRMSGWLIDDLAGYYRHSLSLWNQPEALVRGVGRPISLVHSRNAAPAIDHPLSQLMCIDATTYLPDDILVKVDRAAMAVSLETRIPLLDHRIVEFASRIPPQILIKDRRGKWPLRQVLYRHVPRALVDRPKSGFGVPIASWLRGPLRPWAQELLDRQRIARDGVFDAEQVGRVWKQYLAGGDDYSHHRLWGILMFQSWLDASRAADRVDRSERLIPASKVCHPVST